jgi:protein-S-isoprenylcysteine O-methyltransferase Ste14
MTTQDILIIGSIILISLSGVVTNVLKNASPSEIQSTDDKQSLLLFRVLVPLALVLSLVMYFVLDQEAISQVQIYIGICTLLVGLLIRWWAILSLGNAFTVKLTILKDHILKRTGLYKFIRHPSYTAMLIYYTGLGLLMNNLACITILLCANLFVILRRISLEEKMLNDHFGNEYQVYSRSTYKLIPLIY